MVAIITPLVAGAAPPFGEPTSTVLLTGLQGATGSTVGPDGALYVTEAVPGRVLRVDPETGAVTIFATGLPTRIARIGGAMDVAFLGHTAYVLVTLVGTDVGGSDTVGIYRVDGPDSVTAIADIGSFSVQNPPLPPFGVPTGVQFALQTYRGGFLVSDGHHNRVLHVTLGGEVTEFFAFENIVPTGLAVRGNQIYVAQAGPVPHLPEDGKVVAVASNTLDVTEVAAGAPLLVDVEFGRGSRLYALSQGDFPPDGRDGFPALPDTGALVEVNADGTFTVLVDGLNQPTSLEFIGNTAYVVNLAGEILRIDSVSTPPFGVSHN
jgi:sugar lactone lactonase YvrE